MRRQISQSRITSWLLNPDHYHNSSLKLLPYGWCLRKKKKLSSFSTTICNTAYSFSHSRHSLLVGTWSLDSTAARLGKGWFWPHLIPQEVFTRQYNQRLAWPVTCSFLNLLNICRYGPISPTNLPSNLFATFLGFPPTHIMSHMKRMVVLVNSSLSFINFYGYIINLEDTCEMSLFLYRS